MLNEQAAARVPDAVAGAVITSGVGTSQDARFSEIEAKLKEGGLSAIRVIRKPEVTWDNVAGAKDAKNAIQQSILRPFKRPDLYPAGWDNGMLLYGPPGTGKTLLITATANEVDGTVLEVKSSSIQTKWVGGTEQHIATLFEISHDHSDRHKRPVIIFIDEADALFGESKSDERSWQTTQLADHAANRTLDCNGRLGAQGEKIVRVRGGGNQHAVEHRNAVQASFRKQDLRGTAG